MGRGGGIAEGRAEKAGEKGHGRAEGGRGRGRGEGEGRKELKGGGREEQMNNK